MTADHPGSMPPPDPTAQQWPAVPAQPPAPNSPFPPGYPPSPADYAPPPPTPTHPSMPLGGPNPTPGYPSAGYAPPSYPSAGYAPTGYPAPSGYPPPDYAAGGYPYPYAIPLQAGVSGNALASVICASVGMALIAVGALLGALAAASPADTITSPYEQIAVLPFTIGLAGLVALALSIPAVVTGHIALSKIKRAEGALGGRRAALTGLIMGYCEIAVPVLCLIIFVALVAASLNR